MPSTEEEQALQESHQLSTNHYNLNCVSSHHVAPFDHEARLATLEDTTEASYQERARYRERALTSAMNDPVLMKINPLAIREKTTDRTSAQRVPKSIYKSTSNSYLSKQLNS